MTALALLEAMFLLSMLIEAAACRVLFVPEGLPGTQEWLYAGALHVLSAAVPLLYAYRPKQYPGIGWYLPKFTGLISLFLPVFGIFGMFVTINLTRLFIRSKGLAHDFGQEALHLGPTDTTALNRSLDDMLREELATQPIVDILLGDDEDLKRGAIMLLRRMKNLRAVQLLKHSLSDPSTEVRFFAHTALTQLEEDAVSRLEKASEHAVSGDSKAVRAFAEACREYAQSGLPEETMRTYYLKEARTHYQRYMSLEKQDHQPLLDIGYISLALEDYSGAMHVFTLALDYPETLVAGRLGRCWTYFDQRDWGQLSRETAAMSAYTPEPGEADDASLALYAFWARSASTRRMGAEA